MNRYPLRPKRSQLLLDGSWKFTYLGDADPGAIVPSAITCHDVAAVPGCYDTAGLTIGARGVAVYRTFFTFNSGPARLIFGGLGLYARIYIGDQFIREVKTPYSTIVEEIHCTGEEQALTVVLDNRFDEERVPLFKGYFDFYGYGGIYRSVRLESLLELAIDRAAVSTVDIQTGFVQVRVGLRGNVPAEVRLSYRFDRNQEVCLTLPVERGFAVFLAQVPDFKVWSPESPALHLIHIGIGDDSITERFGMRTIHTEGQGIFLNRDPLYLRGVNRHESHPEFGPVQPLQLMVDDIKWAKELGVNFIRGAHYQQNPEFLELCDEAGILVWNESLAWGFTDHESQRGETVRLLAESTAVMAAECVNNPSVIFCGFLNECNTDTPSGQRMHGKLAEIIREKNANCLVTYAGNRFERDLCCGFVDVISVNPYPGWIGEIGDATSNYRVWMKPRFEQVAQYFSKPEFADKPLLVSESGACGIYGVHDRTRAQWSEEFQADYFAEAIAAVLGNPRYCGITLWQMHDCRSYVNAGQIRSKPRGFNCAGLLDEYRRPKLAFDEVKRIFSASRKQAIS